MAKKKYYLAYGSNLHLQQMRYRCPDAKIVGTAEIDGYELLFKGSKTGSYLTIEKKKGGTVPVAVWEVSEHDEARLDIYEGFPNFYYKTEMTVTVKPIGGRKRKVTAFVYIMHEDRKYGIPSVRCRHTKSSGHCRTTTSPTRNSRLSTLQNRHRTRSGLQLTSTTTAKTKGTAGLKRPLLAPYAVTTGNCSSVL